MKLVDITGQTFGRLFVVRKASQSCMWECKCSCGATKLFTGTNLRSGNSTSCGCLHKEKLAESNRDTKGYLDPWEADMALYKRRLRYRKTRKKLGSNQFSSQPRGHVHPSMRWSLSLAEYTRLVTSDCFYCGQRPDQEAHGARAADLKRNGIDRVDNNKGYEVSNCVPCCVTCNRDKRAQTQQEFISTTKRRYEHLRSIGLLE